MDPQQLREAALYYHRNPKPGKIAVTPIKQLTNQGSSQKTENKAR